MAIFRSKLIYLPVLGFLLIRAMDVEASQQVRLFIVEKSKNPQNILVVYARATAQCTLEPVVIGDRKYEFDFYWLMDGTTYKPTHSLIKKHARKRFVSQGVFEDKKGFQVKLADLKELEHDLPTDLVTITLDRYPDGVCRARVLLVLGPTANNRTLEIQSIYSKARTLLGIPIGIHYIELTGRDAHTLEKMAIRFKSKGVFEESGTGKAAE